MILRCQERRGGVHRLYAMLTGIHRQSTRLINHLLAALLKRGDAVADKDVSEFIRSVPTTYLYNHSKYTCHGTWICPTIYLVYGGVDAEKSMTLGYLLTTSGQLKVTSGEIGI